MIADSWFAVERLFSFGWETVTTPTASRGAAELVRDKFVNDGVKLETVRVVEYVRKEPAE